MWSFLQSAYSMFKVVFQISSLVMQIATFAVSLLEKAFADKAVSA